MEWGNQQKDALDAVSEWFNTNTKGKQIFRVFGYAGTGKTTLAVHFAENVEGDVCFAAFTGKAALQMRRKGCLGATTIHSLIYKAEEKKDGSVSFVLNRKYSRLKNAKLLILDECSMVNEKLARDLLSFGVPILVLGDPAQLPPPEGSGYFTETTPDVMLTEIFRQAEENPLIHMATLARQKNFPFNPRSFGDSVIKETLKKDDVLGADQVLVGRNSTREKINDKIRALKGFDSEYPMVGEKLICLKNDNDLAIYNGGIFYVKKIVRESTQSNTLRLLLEREDGGNDVHVTVHKSDFNPEIKEPHWKTKKRYQSFTFGYCITVHKSQGSQWDNVLVLEESWVFREEWARWLYTGITRAAERVTVVLRK